MSSKDNNEVAVEKIDNDKSADAKCDLKGTKRAAEVSSNGFIFGVSPRQRGLAI